MRVGSRQNKFRRRFAHIPRGLESVESMPRNFESGQVRRKNPNWALPPSQRWRLLRCSHPDSVVGVRDGPRGPEASQGQGNLTHAALLMNECLNVKCNDEIVFVAEVS